MTSSILVVGTVVDPHRQALLPFLQQTTATIEVSEEVPAELRPETALLICDAAQLATTEWKHIEQFLRAGGRCLTLAGPEAWELPAYFGAQLCQKGPQAEVRLLFQSSTEPLAARLPDAFYVQGAFQPLSLLDEHARTILYADWRYEHQPMLTARPVGDGLALLTSLRDSSEPTLQRIFYRLLTQPTKAAPEQHNLGVAILGYAPSVGRLHAAGIAATAGLSLAGICDLNEDRLQAALDQFPTARQTTDARELAADPDVDLVIIATPPNSHANLAEMMLMAGKDVVCEKPLALTMAAAHHMANVAAQQGRHLSCHQNRRWDSDYLMIKQALADGLLGEPFYLETFVGGYGHPCGFWHSHDAVSGGTTFDWGAHYLDWMLDLLPGEISSVLCTRQNRLWHDITNADRERIQLRYANGIEAEFAHSDLAFIPKPKWYLVGSQGALIGRWRKVESYTIDPIHYYQKHDIPMAEMGADITVKRRDGRGGLYEQTLPEPKRDAFPFHRNLADHLLLGEPLTVPLSHTLRVVAVLEAARHSAENGGRPEAVAI